MKPDRPLIGAVLFLAAGLGLIFGYCNGTTSLSAAYPLAGSTLHMDVTTIGPAVLGGLVCTAIGVLLLLWSFLAAIVCQLSLLAGHDRTSERLVERYSVVPTSDGPRFTDGPIIEERKEHFWSKPSPRVH